MLLLTPKSPPSSTPPSSINSLALGKFEWNFRHVILKQILVIDGWGISCEIALIWMSLHFTDDQSTVVQVMAWCRQATSHYLSQCWPRSLTTYGVTRPQWVNIYTCHKGCCQLADYSCLTVTQFVANFITKEMQHANLATREPTIHFNGSPYCCLNSLAQR